MMPAIVPPTDALTKLPLTSFEGFAPPAARKD